MRRAPRIAPGFRPRPPEPRQFLQWPEAFGTRFCLFVDAEEEFDWSRPFDRTACSTKAMAALPAFHARLAERGVPVTYMADHPVATDPVAIECLDVCLSDGRSRIGTQLHAWVNPPFEEAPSRMNSFPGNLLPSLEAAKLDVLTTAIGDAFGMRPLAYRAGRYGVGPATAALLRARGYRLDTSMRSYHDYGLEGGPNFRAIGPHAFDWEGLVELPPTTVYTGLLRRRGVAWHAAAGTIPRGRGAMAQLRLLSRVPLTPEGVPLEEALEAIRIAVGEGVRLLNFGFHTPSLVPGNTPYVRDIADRARFDRWWDGVLDLLDRLHVASASLDEILAAAG